MAAALGGHVGELGGVVSVAEGELVAEHARLDLLEAHARHVVVAEAVLDDAAEGQRHDLVVDRQRLRLHAHALLERESEM